MQASSIFVFCSGWCFGGGGVLSRTFIDMFLFYELISAIRLDPYHR